ncbi:MAG TPA: AAA family ATPase [Terriglobia bacterium]|nr:AAA family ATPase [Terriglobia bacterium]HXY77364.1 AAA family ATPase [Candidatus Acidoferrales bacterium]
MRLPTTRAANLAPPDPNEQVWLIEGLWGARAVGIIGGQPKCYKTFLALDLAVAVASGTPCLRRFPTPRAGRVLLFAAEDALHIVRARLEGIAHAAAAEFQSLDIHVITAPVLRLDHQEHQQALQATVAELKPTLLVLDPLVRLHAIDENVAAEVAPLLAYLRRLQRLHQTAVALVHHARKGAAHERGGQALRGSSELHAWGDSNLYLRRQGQQLLLSIEHRAAQGADRVLLALKANPPALALEAIDQPSSDTAPIQPSCLSRVELLLADATTPLSQKQVREAVRMRTSDVSQALATLVADGRVFKSTAGYQLKR